MVIQWLLLWPHSGKMLNFRLEAFMCGDCMVWNFSRFSPIVQKKKKMRLIGASKLPLALKVTDCVFISVFPCDGLATCAGRTPSPPAVSRDRL